MEMSYLINSGRFSVTAKIIVSCKTLKKSVFHEIFYVQS
jgi:hypothetical protein